LNVCGDLSPLITSFCGIINVAMTSIEKETDTPVSVSCIAASLGEAGAKSD
jgi:lipoate-protein ligase B